MPFILISLHIIIDTQISILQYDETNKNAIMNTKEQIRCDSVRNNYNSSELLLICMMSQLCNT